MKLRSKAAGIYWLILVVACFSVRNGQAQDKSLFEKKVWQSENGVSLPYRILYPDDYNPKQKYPLLVFLHGAGERGNDNEAQLAHGASLFLNSRTTFPAIFVFPQCAKDSYWSSVKIDRNQPEYKFDYNYAATSETPELAAVMSLIRQLEKDHKIDKKRRYIMGLSMGSMGTFEALTRHPSVFAAAIPICSGGDTSLAGNFAKKVPVWVFHGADDSVVHADYSRNMVKAIENAGGKPKYTEYPGVNHNSWDNAFAEPELLKWLFSHRK